MRVLLLNPPYLEETHVREGRCQFKSDLDLPWPPMTLLQISSMLKEKHEVMVIDSMAKKTSTRDLKLSIEDFNPEVVVISTATHTIFSDILICDFIKEVSPQIKIIAIGTHVSAVSTEILKHNSLDFVVRREPEFTLKELIDFIDEGGNLAKVEGISFKRDGKIYYNYDRPFGELSQLPIPDYKSLPVEDYKSPFYGVFGIVNTSRGCPYGCTFCLTRAWYGSCLREKSVDKVIQEIKELQDLGVESIQFYSDTFTIDKQWVMKLCKKLKPMQMEWFCNSRVDTISEEILNKMKSAGCKMIGYGIESMNQKSLDFVKKGHNINQIKKAVMMTIEKDMDVFGYFMLGFPYETKKTLRDAIEFSVNSGMQFSGFSMATPFPGTEFYEYVKRENLITTEDWSQYHYDNPVIKTDFLSTKDMIDLQKEAYDVFYKRPRYNLKMFKRIIMKKPSTSIPLAINFIKKRILQ